LLSLLFVPLASADQTGSLTITSQPPGAQVLVDGAPQGSTPVNVSNVPSGQHQVNLTLSEYHDWSVSQYVSAGQNSVITAALVPVQKNGVLIVTSHPEPASVYVDGTYRGLTPLTLSDAGSGTHQLTVTATGYDPAIATAQVPEGGSFSIDLQLNQTPTTGSLLIGAVPPNADVVIDGVDYGGADHLIESLRPGSHQVQLKADGYQQYQTDITITAGRTLSINATLDPLQQRGSLNVTSVPSGASVKVDGVYLGLTPMVYPGLSAGTHQLTVSADGYSDVVVPVQIRAGEELPYMARLVQQMVTTGVTASTRTTGQPTAATQAATGMIRVSTTPMGANITVDGVFRGVAPQTVRDIPVGTHQIVLSKAGYQDQSRSVTVTDGQAAVVEATLTKVGTAQPGATGTGSASSSQVPTTTQKSGPAEVPLLVIGLLIVGLFYRRDDSGA
jgi:CRISPR/Cas system-associated exonuclease Cas4 (RecB family)